jgi:3-deoxy-manno-octulosonate cytidylyltransferase (CMP-KDO synthetase)
MSRGKRVFAVIPARYHSTRLPGKPLIKIANLSIISRIAEFIKASVPELTDLVVASDDVRVLSEVKESVQTYRSAVNAKTGLERIAEVIYTLGWDLQEDDFILDIQGDMPFIEGKYVNQMIKVFRDHPEFDYMTLITQLKDMTEVDSSSVVKCLVRQQGASILDFNRSVSPLEGIAQDYSEDKLLIKKHIGVYLFTLKSFNEYFKLTSKREDSESLEQLRITDNNKLMVGLEVPSEDADCFMECNDPEDLDRCYHFYFNQYSEKK